MKLTRFFYFLLIPIVIPATLFLHVTYDWYLGLREKNRVLLVLLSFIYIPLSLFLYKGFAKWQKLAE